MGINDGTPVNAATTNPAFMDKNTDTYTLGKADLRNQAADIANSGPNITNMQREFNSISSYTGKPTNQVKDYLPAWINNQVGTPVDDLKARLEALTLRFDFSLGHNHDGTQGNGAPIGASGPTPQVEYRTLTSGEITAKQILLSSVPASAAQTLFVGPGGLLQFYAVDFTVSGGALSWASLALDGVLVAGDRVIAIYWTNTGLPVVARYVEYRTLSGGEITAKQLTLANTPVDLSIVQLDVVGGGPQQLNVDYSVSTNIVSWSGLGLDGVLLAGNVLRISY